MDTAGNVNQGGGMYPFIFTQRLIPILFRWPWDAGKLDTFLVVFKWISTRGKLTTHPSQKGAGSEYKHDNITEKEIPWQHVYFTETLVLEKPLPVRNSYMQKPLTSLIRLR